VIPEELCLRKVDTRRRQRFSWSDLPAPWNPTAAAPGLLPAIQ
jgi:hypothetical protein